MPVFTVFNDYVCDKNQRQPNDYFIQWRHKNCSVVYLSQSFYKTPKDIRLNWVLTTVSTNFHPRESQTEYHELGVDKKHYKAATREPYSFLYVDKPKKRIAKNLTGSV